MAGHAIGRRRRVLKRAHARAQRRFHEMFEAHVWSDPTAQATVLYVEAERLVERLLTEPHPTPLPVVLTALRWPNAYDIPESELRAMFGDR